MKKAFILILILIFFRGFACDCDTPKPAIEFYSSDFVFEGKVISKTYSSDRLTYTITFEIYKHYKKGNNPKRLIFTLKSESEYTGAWTSCDWSVNKNETWLVYARYFGEKLVFDYNCSHSKPLTGEKRIQIYQKLLDSGNSFKIDNYIYQNEQCFNYTKPLSNIDSIFKRGKVKDYEKAFTGLELFIDKKGNLISVNTQNQIIMITDSIFDLPTNFKIDREVTLTEFQKDAIALVEKIKKWEIKRHEKTGVPVSYFLHLNVEFDKKDMLWKYELR